jgi:PIN domain nuclease of toxin-antitoxin system
MSSNETPLAVTDTHALIWMAEGKLKRLGKRARRIFERADAGQCAIYIPTIALVELGEARHKGTTNPGTPFEEWARAAFDSGSYHEAKLTAEIVYVAQRLYAIPERGDRLIAATAVVLDLPLITRDPAIEEVAGVKIIW